MLSRRISAADGSFLGVVAGSVRFSYFHQLFDRLNLGPDDTIGVFRRDGTLIMRRPFDLDKIGKNLGQSPIIKRMLSEPSGSESELGPIDRVSKLYVWRDATGPLAVLVGKPWDDVYALWRTQAIRIGTIMLTLIGLSCAGRSFWSARSAAAPGPNISLEQLATTDALTGLKNRRKFDTVIDTEWRRALRHSTPLALLLIDVDHFKAFNDTFGISPGSCTHRHRAPASRFGAARRRLRGALRRRGIRRAVAGHAGGGRADRGGNHPPPGRSVRRPDQITLTVSVGIAACRRVAMHRIRPGRGRRQGALRGQGRRP